ncbi:hypothetical protein P608_13405 [Comamonas thiooxydans]|uniref:Uncharacterized protein n=1 Tax=Comamonas thiooxydans TaxID=363952 RepID=A0A096ET98_9BURK|nr:hypothetical protein P609_01095 [Comamonas thiooxydans]KGG91588.1 hypothetical protein P369_12250 [Comamonas thiooxydans]KGG97196.1 hypothetical protein P367_17460 [Comamonas thiooxydans]KGH05719.1 hypothetical protein P365_09455 [Comamonas thiooxydans]KGH11678.1 hypothetical protein P608_13405 [Comamonas thiooxydans]
MRLPFFWEYLYRNQVSLDHDMSITIRDSGLLYRQLAKTIEASKHLVI